MSSVVFTEVSSPGKLPEVKKHKNTMQIMHIMYTSPCCIFARLHLRCQLVTCCVCASASGQRAALARAAPAPPTCSWPPSKKASRASRRFQVPLGLGDLKDVARSSGAARQKMERVSGLGPSAEDAALTRLLLPSSSASEKLQG